ncbi:MAG: class I SAM-dependent methyltransferase [Bacteroidota bacterium]
MAKIPWKLWFKYYCEAQTIYSAHSPFVYEFMSSVMQGKINTRAINEIEKKRNQLLVSKNSISFIDYGAGSSIGENTAQRKIAHIAKNSLSGKWQCQFLNRLVRHYGLANILEIGTSLGISTAYLAAANPSGNLITLEGNPESAHIAKALFKDLNYDSIDCRIGEFGTTLIPAIDSFDSIDMAFIDGNHRKEATIEYFHLLKEKMVQKSIVVVDDIYWSEGMNEAWQEIINDDSVAFSVDLFRMGLLFFDFTIMDKRHFKLIPYKYKPWCIGVFG